MNNTVSFLPPRKHTRTIRLGKLLIGGQAPISVQSMTTTYTHDIDATVTQIKALERAGCDIVRLAIPNMKAAESIHKIKAHVQIPLIADIHFDYRLAIKSIEQGIDGLRLNPGNIQRADKVGLIVEKAKEKSIPIRIGVNGGSINRDKYSEVTPESLVDSALEHIKILESHNYHNIKVSIKATDVPMTIASYTLMSQKREYPLHLGVTEAGTAQTGSIKSAIGIGALLAMGIGDTLRVSLSADPVEEVRVGKAILKSLHLRSDGVDCISCPTCGRCEIDVIGISQQVERELIDLNKDLKIAIMGCVVNGPGESMEADLAISGAKGYATLYKNGEKIRKLKENEIVQTLVEEARRF